MLSETPSGRPRRGDAVAPNALRRFGPCAVCRVPLPQPHPDPGPGGRGPGGFGRCPAPSSVPPSGTQLSFPRRVALNRALTIIYKARGCSKSGVEISRTWKGFKKILHLPFQPGQIPQKFPDCPLPGRGTKGGEIPLPDPPGFSCPGTSLVSRGGSPAWEGEGGS